MFKVVASGKSLKFFACVLDTTVSHQFCWNTMSAEMFLQCFDGILGIKVIEFSYFNVLGVKINQYQVMMRSCGTWYSLLLCLLFKHSFQANKVRPVLCIKANMAGLMDDVTQSSSLCRLHHLRLQVHHVTPSILVCCVGPVVLFLATLFES